MEKKAKKILIVESGRGQKVSPDSLSVDGNGHYTCEMAGSVAQFRTVFQSSLFDVVIADHTLDDGNAFDILSSSGGTPVIIMDESGDAETAVSVMRAGAYDFIIKDKEGNYLRVFPMTIENALKRRASEDRIRLLESAVLNANDAIIILEAEPGEGKGRRILFINEAFTRMTGYTCEEAEGNTLRMLRGPGTDLGVLGRIRSALNECRPIRVELINYRKDGSEFWVECNIVPFADEKGSFIHWVSVQRDITERKRAEEEREKLLNEIEVINTDLTELNQQLETIGTERTMSLMALTVADRIRNPSIMIGARCRRILAKHELSDDLRENLHYIIQEADKLNAIVKEFEAFLKSRQSSFKYDDLNRTVEGVISVVEKEISHKGITLDVKTSPEPLKINMQKDLLRVAVFHLIRNAIEATSAGGSVHIETFRDEESVCLSIADTGYGISEKDMENVFKPFFSTKEHGFGLGLPLVKQIISEHLGQLIIESREGKGTVFRVFFPDRWKENNLQ